MKISRVLQILVGLLVVGLFAFIAVLWLGTAPGKADSWVVTYRVSTDPAEAISSTEVAYLDVGEDDPRGDAAEVSASEVGPSGQRHQENSWFTSGRVAAMQTARVTATPPPGVRASCAILVDAGKVLKSKTGEPGKPVTCEVETPEWNNGIRGQLRIP